MLQLGRKIRYAWLKKTLFGRRLRSDEEHTEQLSSVSAIPVVGLDALASAAYGPEAALTVLLVLGNYSSGYIIPISACIVLLLLIVTASYRQTIFAYPQGGGSFTVAKENLGPFPGLLAGTVLCIDYVLNVAVAISAGVGALVSALPVLLPYTLHLCLLILAGLAIINLRGVRSAGVALLFPTYLFIGCLGITILVGMAKLLLMHGNPAPVEPPPHMPATLEAAGGWLLVRAFAAGCTALTGVEAVSNAVPIFRPPSTLRARRTLTIIMSVLAFLLAGIAVLVHAFHISATPPAQAGYQSVLSQLVAAVLGRGWFYYLSISSIVVVLLLSANTSFTGFPRVCQLLSLEEFLPAEFAHRGRRLVYSNGILILTFISGALLVVFGGITDRLIPLFAVGAFGAFTLAQAGMVVHWQRSKESHARRSMIINAVGAIATGLALIVISVAKFAEGAWLTLMVIPVLLVLFLRIQAYHERIDREVNEIEECLECTDIPMPIVVVTLKKLNKVTRKALRLGLSLADEVYAIQVVAEELNTDHLSDVWKELVEEPALREGHPPPRLVVIRSPYREFFAPLLTYIKKLSAQYPERPIAVIVPELVEKKWYNFIFRHRATVLKELLLVNGGPQILIINAPWYLGKREKFEG